MAEVLRDYFEADSGANDSRMSMNSMTGEGGGMAAFKDVAFVKQFIFEFEFLKQVSEQEIERVKEL